MKYLVIYEKAPDGNIWARIPDLDGCFSSGKTLEEAKLNINEAIHLHLEIMNEDGIAIADPKYFEAELITV